MREKNFGFIFWLAVFVFYCLSSSDAEEDAKSRQTFVIRYKDGEQTIPVTVVLDYKKQTEYVINMNPRTPAKSVTLYDFKQRTIAYKDLTNRECFLGRLTHETLNEESSALQDVKNPVEVRPKIRSLDPKLPALTPTEIRNIAGQKTAAFCRKMNTWLLMSERAHGISKREADEFEERTLQYHGHRSSQYSHYERETRRRFRNRSQPNLRRRSRTKESAAENQNGSLTVPESTTFPHHPNSQSSNKIYFNPAHSENAADGRKENHSSDYQIPHNPHSLTHRNSERGKENVHTQPSSNSNINHSQFRNLQPEGIYSAHNNLPIYSTPRSFNSNDNVSASALHHEKELDSSKSDSISFQQSNPFSRLVSEDADNASEVKTITTENPYALYQQGVGYPNVHSSLVHLLPLYKPLSQEFDFDDGVKSKNQTDDKISKEHRNIESEVDPLSTAASESHNKLPHFTDEDNTSHNPDVSVNVLEIPRISKKFENTQNNDSYVPLSQSENGRRFHNSAHGYPTFAQTHSDSVPYIHRNRPHSISDTHLGHASISENANVNNVAENAYFNENNIRLPQPEFPTTTELPILTTRRYFAPDRTTPDNSYVPSVHTAFQNLEDFNSFQVFPNYVENDVIPLSAETNSTPQPIPNDRNKATDASINGKPQHLVITTEYPLRLKKLNTNSNHRSDIPSEDGSDQLVSFNRAEDNIQRNLYPLSANNRTAENFPPHKIRYQTALRDFKPDEIVIDIENIPTHTPPPVTASFHQRILTTSVPTVKSLSAGSIRSDTDKRSEQISGTTWHSFTTTTRFPGRRIIDKSRRPVQSGSIPVPQRGSLNQNFHQLHAPKINPLTGINQFNSAQHANRRQFHYPSVPVSPPRARMPSEMNQLHHLSHLNNLPPGVSVHPRHPQAPFADMVHSNRPPTMPILSGNQEYLKPHRQRHHRKKERLSNSCCRLRGNSGAYQSCCRNGGPCCARSRRRMQPPSVPCCSSPKTNGQIIPASQVQLPVRTTNKILPPIRTEGTHRSEVDKKDRCQKEKMCRTLYESTQQVMVCRNARIEGC